MFSIFVSYALSTWVYLLHNIVSAWTHLVPSVKDPRLERIRALENAYSALQSDLPFLDEQIDLLRGVIADAKHIKEDELMSSYFRLRYDLGSALYTRFQHIREINDLDEAEECLRAALNCPSNVLQKSVLSLLGSVIRERGRELDDREGLEEALALHRRPFLDSSSMSISERASHSRELGLTLRIHYQLFDADISLLKESVDRLRDAHCLFLEAGKDDITSTLGLSRILLIYYLVVTRNESHLEEAVFIAKEANKACDSCSRDLYAVRYELINALRIRGSSLYDTSALDEAIEMLGVLDDPPFGWAMVLDDILILALTERFHLHCREEDISRAITHISKLLAPENPQQERRRGHLQSSLARILHERFSVLGMPEDVEAAIQAVHLSLSTGVQGSAKLARLFQLAICLGEQYKTFGDTAHLDECINLLNELKQSLPSQGEWCQVYVSNLVQALLLRYQQQNEKEDLDQAVQLVEEYSAPWTRTDGLCNAGDAFLLRFELTKCIEDLIQATMFHQKAAERGTGIFSAQDESSSMLSYAKTLRIRFEVLEECDSAAQALRIHKQLTDTLSDAHPDYARALCGLAHVRLCTSSNANDVDEALECLLLVLSNDYCPAYKRMVNTFEVLTYLNLERSLCPKFSHDNAVKLLTVYSTVVSLLPQVASLGLAPRTRLMMITDAGRLTAYGASHAIALCQPDRALEILEAGRGVFWSQTLHLRTQFSGLPDAIGSKLTNIARTLGQPLLETLMRPARDRAVGRRRQLADQFRSTLAEARLLPGFENLLLNANFDSLSLAAASHPIVVFVASDKSSHAIVVSQFMKPRCVVLSNVCSSSLQNISRSLDVSNRRGAGSRGIRKAIIKQEPAVDVYGELWKDVMLPIIEALNWPKSTGRQRPRLALCPTGVFMQLPLHAAGMYTGVQQVSCSDYFVASYTPSIEALLNAQRKSKPLRRTAAETLLVAVDNPFEGVALPMATEEADTIHRLVRWNIARASRCSEVLEHIQSASILHLACHGSQNRTDALQSGFTLDDGLLTVSKLMELELPNAFLAVLSACETAKGDAARPDQAVHLAASMLFAGFRSVVATMWYMGDLDGPVIAESIYSSLFNKDDESEFLDPDHVPYALDEAVQKLRSSGLDPSFWATYIHIGI